MKNLLLFLFVVLKTNFSFSQPNIQWQKCLGGSLQDEAHSIMQTFDGGCIVAGHSKSNDGDITNNNGQFDAWIVKLNSFGDIEWQKTYGGNDYDGAYDIKQTYDGGFIIAAITTGMNYSSDYWIIKTDSIGNIIWQKIYGGTSQENIESIDITDDGGYIVAGSTASNDGDVIFNHNPGWVDYWVLKLDSLGNLEWQKSLGGTSHDHAREVLQTNDGGFVVAGWTTSNDGDITNFLGGVDYWIVKLDSVGNLVWEKSYGGTLNDWAYSIKNTHDGGFIVVGISNSVDGDISNALGDKDVWLLKLDFFGNKLWQKSFGGTGGEGAHFVNQTVDNGFIIAGFAHINSGHVSGVIGNVDFWIIKADSSGIFQWQKCLGGTNSDEAYSIQETLDGSVIVTGRTTSNDIDVLGNNGWWDFWVVKLSVPNSINEDNFDVELSIFPNPSTSEVNISFTLKETKEIKIELYNSLGQVVKTISKHKFIAGKNQINITTENLSKGIYHIKFSVGDDVVTRKLVKM